MVYPLSVGMPVYAIWKFKQNLLWREQVRCGTFQYFSKHRTNSSESPSWHQGIIGEIRNSCEVMLGRFTLRPCSEVNIAFAHTWKIRNSFSHPFLVIGYVITLPGLCTNGIYTMIPVAIDICHRPFDLLGLWDNKPIAYRHCVQTHCEPGSLAPNRSPKVATECLNVVPRHKLPRKWQPQMLQVPPSNRVGPKRPIDSNTKRSQWIF